MLKSGLPKEVREMANEMGVGFDYPFSKKVYHPYNKLRKPRSRKKLRKQRIVKASKKKNRSVW